jgi:hypothetical protein
MFRTRCCNIPLGWIAMVVLVSAGHLVACGDVTEAQALEGFLAQSNRGAQGDATIEMNIEASLPKLHKSANLRTVWFVPGMGRSVFHTLESQGDAMVRRELIARYIEAETEARESPDPAVAVSAANYRFLFRGVTDYAGQPVYVYRLEPKRKRAGLFQGEIWLDTESGSVLREWGEFNKSPSWFVRTVYFVRDYTMEKGPSRPSAPRRLILSVTTRLFGRADMTIWFKKVPDTLRNGALDLPEEVLSGSNGRPQAGVGQ